jgi:putative membrane protein
MKRFAQLACAVVAAASMAACAGDNNARTDYDAAPGATGTTGTAGTTTDVDRGWINEQLRDGDLEVRLGRLAQERGASADVRAFGAMMVEKHTMAGTELKRLANQHNVPADAERDNGDEADDEIERLSKLSGAEFDRAYLDLMVEEHEDAIDALEKKARDDDEHADVRDWANKTLADVRQHLQRAKDLRERLDR